MTTTISDADERRINTAVTQLAAVEQLHHRIEEDVIPFDCADGGCDHEEAALGEECPTVKLAVCAHCFGLVQNADPENYIPSDVHWPCATAKAFGAVA